MPWALQPSSLQPCSTERDMVELLLENQADKTIQDAKGMTALAHAEVKKASEIVKLLQI